MKKKRAQIFDKLDEFSKVFDTISPIEYSGANFYQGIDLGGSGENRGANSNGRNFAMDHMGKKKTIIKENKPVKKVEDFLGAGDPLYTGVHLHPGPQQQR